jgi:integrase/recombinase XerC
VRRFLAFTNEYPWQWTAAHVDEWSLSLVAICHEWNTIAHLNQYEGRPEARRFTRTELQRFLGYADEQGWVHARAGVGWSIVSSVFCQP